MIQIRIFALSAILIFTAAAVVQDTRSAAASSASQSTQSTATIAAIVDREISTVEKQIVEAAEAMPEDKFNFSPESLNIPGSEYKGVRTFAVQVKHVASSNYFIWSPLTGDKVPESIKDGNGPADLKTKADIIKLLKDYFALGSKDAAMLSVEDILTSTGRRK